MDVGFIGIGSMGAAMVPNLVKAGHRVEVWNRHVAAAEALAGVAVLASPAVAFQNEVVIHNAIIKIDPLTGRVTAKCARCKAWVEVPLRYTGEMTPE